MTLRSWFPLEQEFRPWRPFHTAVALPICAAFPTSDEDLWGGGDDNHEDGGCGRDDGGGDRDDIYIMMSVCLFVCLSRKMITLPNWTF